MSDPAHIIRRPTTIFGLILFAALVTMPPSTSAAQPAEVDTETVSSDRDQEIAEQAADDTEQESTPEEFDPTEEISEDSSVPFPTDI